MKPIYNFKINDSKVKNIFWYILLLYHTVTKCTKCTKKFFFTWLQHLTIAQTPAWRYNYNCFHDKKKKIPST